MHMKKLLTLAFALVALASAAMAQEKAKIYFLRSTGFSGSATSFKCFIDKKIVCNLNNKRYSLHEVDSGRHQVDVQFSGKEYKQNDEPVFIDVEPGKTYYVQLTLKAKFISDLLCQEITQNTAKVMMKELKEDNCF